MSRVTVIAKDKMVILIADRMEEQNGMLYIYNCDTLVGLFDGGDVSMAYMTKQKEV